MSVNSSIRKNNTPESLSRTLDHLGLPEQVPQQLLVSGSVSPEQWRGMDNASKLSLLERYLGENWAEIIYGQNNERRVEASDPQVENVQKTPDREINVAELKEQESAKKEFEDAKLDLERELQMDRQNNQIEIEEVPYQPEEQLTQEERARINTERGCQGVRGVLYQFFGYQPSDNVIQNYDELADKGSVTDASTWLATMLRKIFAVNE